jgi:hypothetical protein
MVTGYYVGTAAVGAGGAIAGIAAQKVGRTRPVAICGISGCGKTGLHYCIDHDLHPIFELERKSTTEKGRRHRKKLKLEKHGKVYLKHIDYPGGAEYVTEQIDETKARWGIIMTDVEQWGLPENWAVIEEMVTKIIDPVYQRKHTAKYWLMWYPWSGWVQKRVPFTGKGLKMITLVLNKVDLVNPPDRGWFCRAVADHFLRERAGNPLNKIRHDIPLQFVATSLKHGIYYPYSNLDGEPLKLETYFDEVMTYI